MNGTNIIDINEHYKKMQMDCISNYLYENYDCANIVGEIIIKDGEHRCLVNYHGALLSMAFKLKFGSC